VSPLRHALRHGRKLRQEGFKKRYERALPMQGVVPHQRDILQACDLAAELLERLLNVRHPVFDVEAPGLPICAGQLFGAIRF